MPITISNPYQTQGYNLSKIALTNKTGSFIATALTGATTTATTPLAVTAGSTLTGTHAAAGKLLYLNAISGQKDVGLYADTGVDTVYTLIPNDVDITAVIPHDTTFPVSPSPAAGNLFYLTAPVTIGGYQIGLYVFDKKDAIATTDTWNLLKNDSGIIPSTGVIPVAHGSRFPTVAVSYEFPTSVGSAVGVGIGCLFKLTATYNGFSPGLYYNSGFVFSGKETWRPVTIPTTTVTAGFSYSVPVGPDLPTTLTYTGPIYSPKWTLTDGKLFYKSVSDTVGVEGLYVVLGGAWVLASI